ncbi:sigma-70 family RNA polymerase sigma factor [Terrimonas sp. NA20]|uniref:Sigma-70 family RNA polymerase sigma factor n=1 Tax=Terrimonas ginsenosidimutans TaxID=2908004 RepID=A0ABS9KUL2_9BACT|nr:sigma-70 family RNA polymerase sigma factor [Terrimonas ginsenosidimutans]MCG2615970.1 sigma-70 family RNA polymerase sigma factor [Terrimonas ginsenosidimutans]
MSSLQPIQFDSLYEQYHEMVFQLCTGFLKGDREMAADLTQDVFINTWNAWSSYRGEASHKTWIYRITVNTCLQYLRKQKNKRNVGEEQLQDHAEEERTDDVHFTDLYQAIGQLNDLDRLIIMMVLEEIDYPEISQIVGISEGNLRVRIHRIKQKLKKLLGNG